MLSCRSGPVGLRRFLGDATGKTGVSHLLGLLLVLGRSAAFRSPWCKKEKVEHRRRHCCDHVDRGQWMCGDFLGEATGTPVCPSSWGWCSCWEALQRSAVRGAKRKSETVDALVHSYKPTGNQSASYSGRRLQATSQHDTYQSCSCSCSSSSASSCSCSGPCSCSYTDQTPTHTNTDTPPPPHNAPHDTH